MRAASITIQYAQRTLGALFAAFGVSIACAVPPSDGVFGSAAVVPADVSIMVRVRGAQGLRADTAMLPAQAALLRLAGSRVLVQTWDRLAADLGVDASSLVDMMLGTDVTYTERTRDGHVEWAIVTRIEQPLLNLLVEKLKPATAAGGRSIYPAQQVATAWRPPNLVLGPSDRTALFDEVVGRIDASKSDDSLAGSVDLAAALAWDPAPVEVVWRHDLPTGGMTVFTARAADGQLRIRHRSRFVRAPVHVASGAPADAGLLRALDGAGIAALVMNPWRGALDEQEVVDAFLMEGGFDEAMRSNMGARQVLVVGETVLDGTRVHVPTLGIAFEVRDPILAEKQWDGWGQRFAESVARRAGMEPPQRAPAEPGAARSVDIGPAVRSIFADHPFARPIRLGWITQSGANGSWQVVATDPALLAKIGTAITTAERMADPDDAHELGIISGRALAAHLRSWTTEPALFVPETPEPFVQGVSLAADIVSVAPRVRWRARSPMEGVIESEFVVELPKEPAPTPLPAPAPTPVPVPAP
ncbi:MAG: hypothetical protein NT059_07675 [Planctomycetota bacterium]|nr:hypothetical protein [Planctomycetota bacterium]